MARIRVAAEVQGICDSAHLPHRGGTAAPLEGQTILLYADHGLGDTTSIHSLCAARPGSAGAV